MDNKKEEENDSVQFAVTFIELIQWSLITTETISQSASMELDVTAKLEFASSMKWMVTSKLNNQCEVEKYLK